MWPWVNHEMFNHKAPFGAQLTNTDLRHPRCSATWAYTSRLPPSNSLVAVHAYNHSNAEHGYSNSNWSATRKHLPDPTQHKTSRREMCGKVLLFYIQNREGGNFPHRCAKLHFLSCPVRASHLPRHFPKYCTVGYSEVGFFSLSCFYKIIKCLLEQLLLPEWLC